MERDDWIRRVGLLLGFRELPEQIRRQLGRLADLRYTDRGAAEFMRKQLEPPACAQCDGSPLVDHSPSCPLASDNGTAPQEEV